MTTLNNTPAPTQNEALILGLLAEGTATVAGMVAETGKTAAAIRSVLNRMTHKGLIMGGSTAPALPAAPKPAFPAPIINVRHQNKEWLVAVEGAVFTGTIARTRPEALELAVSKARNLNLGHFTLVNKLGRTVSYTIKGDKAVKGAVA